MHRLVTCAAALAIAMSAGCGDRIEYRDLPCDADDGTIDAPAVDATPDAVADAALDAAPDAAQPTCVAAGDTASHLEPVGGSGGNPQMTPDSFGAVAAVARSGGGRLTLLGADGLRRAADLDLTVTPAAIAFDGLGYKIVEQVAGPTVQLRTVSATGTVGAPIVIGAGFPVYGAIAVHPSGDVAVLWTAQADGSLRATVVPAVGSPVETVLDAPASFVNTQLVGGVVATQTTAARFVAAFARVDSIAATTVMARPLAPAGAAQVVSSGSAAMRQRVGIAASTSADTALITWRDAAAVHVATFHSLAGIVVADRAVIAQTAGAFTRVAGRAAPGPGFEILLDHAVTATDRGLFLYRFDAIGDPVAAPRRVATICTNAYSEENLAFVRNASVHYATWFDLTLPDNIAASF